MSELEMVRQDLTQYLDAVAAQKEGRTVNLAAAVMALEVHSQNPPASIPAPLKHYLESRSYRKAWEWIEGQTPAKGSCGN